MYDFSYTSDAFPLHRPHFVRFFIHPRRFFAPSATFCTIFRTPQALFRHIGRILYDFSYTPGAFPPHRPLFVRFFIHLRRCSATSATFCTIFHTPQALFRHIGRILYVFSYTSGAFPPHRPLFVRFFIHLRRLFATSATFCTIFHTPQALFRPIGHFLYDFSHSLPCGSVPSSGVKSISTA